MASVTGKTETKEMLQLYEDQAVRTAWDEQEEQWYFSVVDVVSVLTNQPDARHASTYWAVLKKRLAEEGADELLTNCKQLKLRAADGKRRATDVATTEQLLRIIQSIPSKKAEPFKLWLASVGRERIDETLDPEKIVTRLVATYERKGYTREWINQRLQAISIRKELTDEWKDKGIAQSRDFAMLTDEITKAWSGMTTRQYKNLKGLKKESLRDNMSNLELALNMLAEAATAEISKEKKATGLEKSIQAAMQGGEAARVAKESVEQTTGKKVVTDKTAGQLRHTKKTLLEEK